MAEPTTHNAERGYPMAASAASTRLLFFGAKTNVRQHNSQNVYSYLLDTYAVVLLYAEDAEPNRKPVKPTAEGMAKCNEPHLRRLGACATWGDDIRGNHRNRVRD